MGLLMTLWVGGGFNTNQLAGVTEGPITGLVGEAPPFSLPAGFETGQSQA